MAGADRKVKGTIHWVSAQHAVPAEVRLYDRLFNVPIRTTTTDGKTYRDHLNPDSRRVVRGYVEPAAARRRAGAVVPVRAHRLFRRRSPRPSQRRAGVQPQRHAARYLGGEGLNGTAAPFRLIVVVSRRCSTACAAPAAQDPAAATDTQPPALDRAAPWCVACRGAPVARLPLKHVGNCCGRTSLRQGRQPPICSAQAAVHRQPTCRVRLRDTCLANACTASAGSGDRSRTGLAGALMLYAQVHLTLPAWVHEAVDTTRVYAGDADKVALAIDLSRRNIDAEHRRPVRRGGVRPRRPHHLRRRQSRGAAHLLGRACRNHGLHARAAAHAAHAPQRIRAGEARRPDHPRHLLAAVLPVLRRDVLGRHRRGC